MKDLDDKKSNRRKRDGDDDDTEQATGVRKRLKGKNKKNFKKKKWKKPMLCTLDIIQSFNKKYWVKVNNTCIMLFL